MTKETKPRGTKGKATPPTKRHDWNSREGRAALRLAILREMAEMPMVPRGIIASRIGIGNSENALRATTTALKMLASTGHVEPSGEGPLREYRITKAGQTMAKEAGR